MNQNNSTISTHPEWCIDEHDNLNPIEDNIHYSESVSITNVLNLEFGDGTTAADVRRFTDPAGGYGINVNIMYEVTVAMEDVEAIAKELEALAQAVRDYAAKL